MKQLLDRPVSVLNTVEHAGVKGMKWGKRKKKDPRLDPQSSADFFKTLTPDEQVEYLYNLQMFNPEYASRVIELLPDKGFNPDVLIDMVGVPRKDGSVKLVRKDSLDSKVHDLNKQIKQISDKGSIKVKQFEQLAKEAGIKIDELLPSIKKVLDPKNLSHTDLVNLSLPKDSLAHYGVLGMKWGVRKDRSSTRKSKASKIDTLKERRTNKVLEKGRRSNTFSDNRQNRRMSDQELTKLINRLSLEQRLGQLTHVPAPPESRWKKLGKDIAFDVTRGAATEVGKLILAQALKVEFNKRASVPYQIPVKEIKKAIDNVT